MTGLVGQLTGVYKAHLKAASDVLSAGSNAVLSQARPVDSLGNVHS